MTAYLRTAANFAAFKRMPLHIVLASAFASVVLAAGMWLQGQPLYIIATFALLPWVPVVLFESLWKIKHYHWIAIFAVMTMLQLGHLMEHIVQVSVLSFTQGTLACPPPVDTLDNANRAVEAGLRSPDYGPIYMSASTIVKPGPDGTAVLDANGQPVSGPHACGIFGQLDLEIVHLVWEMLGWFCLLALVIQYPQNPLLWFSLLVATFHTVEHLFISYTYFFDPVQMYEGTRQIWGTIAEGNLVTAYPLGQEPAIVNFYAVAGKNGILAKGGLIGMLFPAVNPYLPMRPYLHFYYNSLVIIPATIAFAQEIRKVYDRYLRRALPALTTQEVVAVTPRLVVKQYRTGDVIVHQGDPLTAFYIVSRGVVEMVQIDPDGWGRPLATLCEGDSFGAVGIVGEALHVATVRALTDVEVLKLDRAAFEQMVGQPEAGRFDIQKLLAHGYGAYLPTKG